MRPIDFDVTLNFSRETISKDVWNNGTTLEDYIGIDSVTEHVQKIIKYSWVSISRKERPCLLSDVPPLLTNQRSRTHLQNLAVTQLVNNFPRLLRSLKFHYRVKNNLHMGPILSQLTQIHALIPYLFKAHLCPRIFVILELISFKFDCVISSFYV